MTSTCNICGRKLDIKEDPLSGDCGGDCWGCIGEIEADMGGTQSLEIVQQEYKEGLRPLWVPSPSIFIDCTTEIKQDSEVNITISIDSPLGFPWVDLEVEISYLSMTSDLLSKESIDNFNKRTNRKGKLHLPFNYPKLSLGRTVWIDIGYKSKNWSFPVRDI